MRIKIFYEREGKEKEIEFNGKTVRDLLNYLGLDWSRHVVIKNGEIVTEDEEIEEGDYIKILDVVSGG
ncbi:MAG TPA: MoaD/ThiS family protein [Candidatus Nanopusillus sp.]|nr:MoaD/ThiS family protein [Candidatus Nanopusillus sp.]